MTTQTEQELAREISSVRTQFRTAEAQKTHLNVQIERKTAAAIDAAAAACGLSGSQIIELLCRNAHRFVFIHSQRDADALAAEDRVIVPVPPPSKTGDKKIVKLVVTKTAKMIVEAKAHEEGIPQVQFIELMAAGLPRLSLADLVSCDPLDHPDLSENPQEEDTDDSETSV